MSKRSKRRNRQRRKENSVGNNTSTPSTAPHHSEAIQVAKMTTSTQIKVALIGALATILVAALYVGQKAYQANQTLAEVKAIEARVETTRKELLAEKQNLRTLVLASVRLHYLENRSRNHFGGRPLVDKQIQDDLNSMLNFVMPDPAQRKAFAAEMDAKLPK